jgi:hypothetical protein
VLATLHVRAVQRRIDSSVERIDTVNPCTYRLEYAITPKTM